MDDCCSNANETKNMVELMVNNQEFKADDHDIETESKGLGVIVYPPASNDDGQYPEDASEDDIDHDEPSKDAKSEVESAEDESSEDDNIYTQDDSRKKFTSNDAIFSYMNTRTVDTIIGGNKDYIIYVKVIREQLKYDQDYIYFFHEDIKNNNIRIHKCNCGNFCDSLYARMEKSTKNKLTGLNENSSVLAKIRFNCDDKYCVLSSQDRKNDFRIESSYLEQFKEFKTLKFCDGDVYVKVEELKNKMKKFADLSEISNKENMSYTLEVMKHGTYRKRSHLREYDDQFYEFGNVVMLTSEICKKRRINGKNVVMVSAGSTISYVSFDTDDAIQDESQILPNSTEDDLILMHDSENSSRTSDSEIVLLDNSSHRLVQYLKKDKLTLKDVLNLGRYIKFNDKNYYKLDLFPFRYQRDLRYFKSYISETFGKIFLSDDHLKSGGYTVNIDDDDVKEMLIDQKFTNDIYGSYFFQDDYYENQLQDKDYKLPRCLWNIRRLEREKQILSDNYNKVLNENDKIKLELLAEKQLNEKLSKIIRETNKSIEGLDVNLGSNTRCDDKFTDIPRNQLRDEQLKVNKLRNDYNQLAMRCDGLLQVATDFYKESHKKDRLVEMLLSTIK